MKKIFTIILMALAVGAVRAQKAEVTMSLNEPFFDALIDSMYKNFEPPQFSLAAAEVKRPEQVMASYRPTEACEESITLLRERNGIKTAFRFRDGKIQTPMAFSGKYQLPL